MSQRGLSFDECRIEDKTAVIIEGGNKVLEETRDGERHHAG